MQQVCRWGAKELDSLSVSREDKTHNSKVL